MECIFRPFVSVPSPSAQSLEVYEARVTHLRAREPGALVARAHRPDRGAALHSNSRQDSERRCTLCSTRPNDPIQRAFRTWRMRRKFLRLRKALQWEKTMSTLHRGSHAARMAAGLGIAPAGLGIAPRRLAPPASRR